MTARQIGALLLLAAVWGASFLFIRVAVPALGPFPLMAGRVLIAAAALGLVARVRGTALQLRPYVPRLLLLGLVHAAAPFALIAAAEIRLTASMAAVLIAVQPLFAALIGAIWLGEDISFRRGAGLLLGLVGVGVLVGWSPVGLDRGALMSIGASLLASASYAAGAIYARHRLADAPVLTLALGQQLGAAVWLLVPALISLPQVRLSGPALGALLALGLVCTALAYLVFFWLLAQVGQVRAATVTYVIPAFGVLWGTLLLGEAPAPGLLGGLGCIVLSLRLVHRAPAKPLPARTRAAPARS